jgi:hypothetical protein
MINTNFDKRWQCMTSTRQTKEARKHVTNADKPWQNHEYTLLFIISTARSPGPLEQPIPKNAGCPRNSLFPKKWPTSNENWRFFSGNPGEWSHFVICCDQRFGKGFDGTWGRSHHDGWLLFGTEWFGGCTNFYSVARVITPFWTLFDFWGWLVLYRFL